MRADSADSYVGRREKIEGLLVSGVCPLQIITHEITMTYGKWVIGTQASRRGKQMNQGKPILPRRRPATQRRGGSSRSPGCGDYISTGDRRTGFFDRPFGNPPRSGRYQPLESDQAMNLGRGATNFRTESPSVRLLGLLVSGWAIKSKKYPNHSSAHPEYWG